MATATTTTKTETQATIRDITTTIDTEREILSLKFSNGKTLEVDANKLVYEIRTMATMHGLKQKLVDAAALGQNATIGEKYDAVVEVFNRLMAGSWNKGRAEGETRSGLLFMALCRLYPARTEDNIREFLSGKSKKQQAELRANPRVAHIIDEIRAERTSGTDTDALLDELEGDDE